MGKIKTHKASAKRYTITKGGKVKINHNGKRHKTGQKSSKRLMHLRHSGYLSKAMAPNIKKMLPYD